MDFWQGFGIAVFCLLVVGAIWYVRTKKLWP